MILQKTKFGTSVMAIAATLLIVSMPVNADAACKSQAACITKSKPQKRAMKTKSKKFKRHDLVHHNLASKRVHRPTRFVVPLGTNYPGMY